MNKKLWILVAGALAASVIAATAQEVLSANAVGYIKKTLPANGGLVAMGIPLDPMDEADVVFGNSSVAEEAPVGSMVYFWDAGAQNWLPGSKTSKGWGAFATRVVQAGEGFFLQGNPSDATDRDVTITGEVPPIAQLSRAIPGGGALGTVANPYPVDFVFGDSDLAVNASVGSMVYFWDVASQNWLPGSKTSKGWGAFATRQVLAGDGFFLQETGAGSTWDAARPYTWPAVD